MIRDMMSPCMIAIIFLLIVLYFTYEPGSLPFLGGAEDAEGEKDKGKDKAKKKGEEKKDPALQDAEDTIDEFDLDETTSSFVAKTADFVMELMTEAPHRCHD